MQKKNEVTTYTFLPQQLLKKQRWMKEKEKTS